MKTKIVYVLVSDGKSVYFERAFVSAWSVKYHNPTAHIAVLIDSGTKEVLDKDAYDNFMNLIDEEIVVPINNDFSNLEKSRWMKTQLRELVKGDFLYLDVDTISCEDLSDIDNETCSVGMVWDFNCKLSDNHCLKIHRRTLKYYFNQEIVLDGNYYNSGVIYAKDNDDAHVFFRNWHKNWLHTRRKGYYRDQLSLLKTTIDNPTCIREISGVYNSQVSISLCYFHEAKIIHFYKMVEDFSPTPFLSNKFYLDVRKNKDVSEKMAWEILHCKSSFNVPTLLCGDIDLQIVSGNIYKLLKHIYRSHHFVLQFLKAFCNLYYSIKTNK